MSARHLIRAPRAGKVHEVQVDRMYAILSSVEDDIFEPDNLDRLRDSVATLNPGQTDAVELDRAVLVLQDFQRLQRRDRRYGELIDNLHRLLESTGGIWPTAPATSTDGRVDGATGPVWPLPVIPANAEIRTHFDNRGTTVVEFVGCP